MDPIAGPAGVPQRGEYRRADLAWRQPFRSLRLGVRDCLSGGAIEAIVGAVSLSLG
jgi:hypothetical protein